ncbi:MAG: GTP-binding protein [Gemmatimonadaceae bacterium]
MPIVNHTAREITCKIVYCGPGGSGKTSNLLHVYGELPEDRKGKMMSLATEADSSLFFDFLPVDLGKIADFSTRLQLYTVPGQVFYEATRRLVLEGVDGVVFVADSQTRQLEDNIESLQDLHANLAAHAVDARKLPMVMQYNKRDLPESEIMPVDDLDEILNFRGVPSFPADALRGTGVFESLRAITQLVFQGLDSGNGAGK